MSEEVYLKDGIQSFCGEIKESACYALSLLDVAREYNHKYNNAKTFDLLELLYMACSSTDKTGVIYYNRDNLNDNNNFYVQRPEELLKMATGKEWKVVKEYNTRYHVQNKKEYIINYYERECTGHVTGHFEREKFHPIKNSLTVKYGSLKSLRVCTVIYG